MLDQQRTIDKQREREQLENRADAIAAGIRLTDEEKRALIRFLESLSGTIREG